MSICISVYIYFIANSEVDKGICISVYMYICIYIHISIYMDIHNLYVSYVARLCASEGGIIDRVDGRIPHTDTKKTKYIICI